MRLFWKLMDKFGTWLSNKAWEKLYKRRILKK